MPVIRPRHHLPAHIRLPVHQIEHLHPEIVPLFRNCRWGLNQDGHLAFDQIPDQPNTSTARGWHYSAAKALADALGVHATVTDTEIVITPLDGVAKGVQHANGAN